jgi:hypothetical protein
MTSPLRRKRLTIAPNTSRAIPRWTAWVAAVLLIGTFAGLQPVRAADDSGSDKSVARASNDSASDKSSVQQVSYQTGKTGNRLKWTGTRRAEPVRADKAVRRTQCTTPEAACEPSCGGVQPVQELQPSSEAWSKSLGRKGRSAESELGPLPNGGNSPTNPLLQRQLNVRSQSLKAGCPSPKDLKHIRDLTTNIAPSEGELPQDCPLGDETFGGRCFAPITYTWTASQLCHKPLYFEDVQLERYGHMAGPWVQPFASAANFFLTFPILPYKIGLELPNECIYTLGYYRPGDCAPYLFDPLPISVRGLFFESGAWVAGCALFP